MTQTLALINATWETSSDSMGLWDVCEEGGGDMVADLSACGTPEQQEARANLIAAAPELLALAVERMAWIEEQAGASGDDPTAIDWQYDALRAAIAKAEGRS